MMRLLIGFIFFTCFGVFAQETVLNGEVTFVTSNNIYVKFEDTSLIFVGDSLNLENHKGSACLFVNSKSSTSCVCTVLDDCAISKGAKVYFIPPFKNKTTESIVQEEIPVSILKPEDLEVAEPLYLQEIRARISASTYSTVSNDREDRHRLMGRLSIDADHINNSRFSFNLYTNYRHIFDVASSSNLANTDLLRIFNLAVGYEATPTVSLLLGRNINPKIASLGAIDGLQAEKQLGNSYLGVIAGTRPDIFNYGYNFNLLEYGAYFGQNINTKDVFSQSTIGFIEQRNGAAIDRRFTYLQHSSTLFKNLNLFASAEMDMFSKIDSTATTNLSLTNLYTSARYRFSRGLNLMVSYDSRKRIIYYETYRSDIEQLLDDDLARQGVRARLNIRPIKNVFTGVSYSKRFQSDEQNNSDNIYGFVTLSKTPFIEGRTTFSYNRNESNYLLSNIGSFRHSRSFMRDRLNMDFYYRFVHYDYSRMADKLSQHYIGTDLSYNINRNLLFSLTGEFSMYEDSKNYRVYTRIVQRFHSKHKK